MKTPIRYTLDELDGSFMERSAFLQDVRDKGLLETADLTAFCFEVEALLNRAEHREVAADERSAELADRETALMRDMVDNAQVTTRLVIGAFDDLLAQLPKSADILHAALICLLKEMGRVLPPERSQG